MTTRPSHRPSPRCLTVPVPLFRFSVSLPRSQPLSEQIFHEAANDTAGGFLHIRCDVGVGVQREAGIGMPQNSRQGFGVHAAGDGVGGEGMPQIVEPKSLAVSSF